MSVRKSAMVKSGRTLEKKSCHYIKVPWHRGSHLSFIYGKVKTYDLFPAEAKQAVFNIGQQQL